MSDRPVSELSDRFLAGAPQVSEADRLAVAAAELVTSPAAFEPPAGWVDPAVLVDDD